MSVLTQFGDTAYAIRFLRLLTMPWEKTEAFKQGIIDKDGNKIKKPSTPAEKQAYTPFHRLVFNIRRLLARVPLGKTSIARYASALWLLKEETGMSEAEIAAVLNEATGYNPLLDLNESYTGVNPDVSYYLTEDPILPLTGERMPMDGDAVQIKETAGHIFNIPVYRVKHEKTGAKLIITTGEL